MRKPTLILGGPGCGKTTALLKIVEKALDKGVQPERIAFVAFTRKAAQEARDRMSDKFNIDVDDIPNFKTLHSFAYAHTGIDRAQILDDKKMVEYAKAEGLVLTPEYVDEFGQSVPQARTIDEEALNAYALSRLTQTPLEEVCIASDLDTVYTCRIAEEFKLFKQEAMVVDFTDMIEIFCNEGTCPHFDLLIVDEAQDLSSLQWRMVDKLVSNSKDVYFAGDDDQAIYSWAGADLAYFLSMDADREVLPVSYRLKSNVFDACQKVVRYIDDRYPKDWSAHAEGGSVEFVSNLDHLDLSEGTWFLLARTNSLVRSLAKHLRTCGYAYMSPTKKGMKSSVDTDVIRAVLTYENLRQGKRFSGDHLENVWGHLSHKPTNAPIFSPDENYGLIDLCSTGFDASKSWLDVMSVPDSVKMYIRMLRGHGESLTKTPRITVSTIHGVKGGEADNVVIAQKLTSLTYKSWVNSDASEYRALFTAMSRARDRLIFLDTTTRESYRVERLLQ